MSKPLCIYHANCADGFAAAWVVRKYFKENVLSDEPEFFPGVYQTPPPDCTGRDVIIVDFSYKHLVMEEILGKCKSLTWIDHHKTAIEDMAQLLVFTDEKDKFKKLTELHHSGAMLTWMYYFPGIEPPTLLKHIEDRDLWRFELEGTREIQANIFSFPYDFEVWDDLMTLCKEDGSWNQCFDEGAAIERKHFKDIHELLNIYTRWMCIGGVKLPVANLPYTMSSDAGHILAENAANGCAACYSDAPDGRIFSLRSSGKEGSQDVSEIAKIYGGGGHRNAAGFKVSFEKAKEFEIASPF